MSELRELYQELILDHGRHPRNHAFPEGANRTGIGFNALCGDKITLKLRCKGNIIEDIGFEGSGCTISQAAASTMTEAIKGKTIEEAQTLFQNFHNLITHPEASPSENLGKLEAFAGVAEFPMRVKCATLAWRTLEAALQNNTAPASTE